MSAGLFEKGNAGKSVMDEAVNVVKEVFHQQQWNFAGGDFDPGTGCL